MNKRNFISILSIFCITTGSFQIYSAAAAVPMDVLPQETYPLANPWDLMLFYSFNASTIISDCKRIEELMKAEAIADPQLKDLLKGGDLATYLKSEARAGRLFAPRAGGAALNEDEIEALVKITMALTKNSLSAPKFYHEGYDLSCCGCKTHYMRVAATLVTLIKLAPHMWGKVHNAENPLVLTSFGSGNLLHDYWVIQGILMLRNMPLTIHCIDIAYKPLFAHSPKALQEGIDLFMENYNNPEIRKEHIKDATWRTIFEKTGLKLFKGQFNPVSEWPGNYNRVYELKRILDLKDSFSRAISDLKKSYYPEDAQPFTIHFWDSTERYISGCQKSPRLKSHCLTALDLPLNEPKGEDLDYYFNRLKNETTLKETPIIIFNNQHIRAEKVGSATQYTAPLS